MNSADRRARPLVDFGVPAAILAALSLLFIFIPIDLTLAGWFFSESGGWFLKDAEPFRLVYKQGLIPALCVAGGAAIVLLLGFASVSVRKYRRVTVYLLLVMLIGPGLLVNALMKEGWGRPRPRQVEGLGGEERYERLWEYDASSYGKSFPSGHAAMGFYFFAAYFLLRREGRRSVYLWLGIALGLGFVLGVTRIVQGGHFLSDVVWSAGVCYFVAAGLYYLMGLPRSLGFAGGRMSRGAIVACLLAMLGIGALAVGTPYHEEKAFLAPPEQLAEADKVRLELDLPRANLRVSIGEQFSISAEAEGFGSPGSRLEDRFEASYNPQMREMSLELHQEKGGFFATLEQPMRVTVPGGRVVDADISIGRGVLVLDLGDGGNSASGTGTGTGAQGSWDFELGDVSLTLLVPDDLELKIELQDGVADSMCVSELPGLTWDGEKRRWKRGETPVVKLRLKSLRQGKVLFKRSAVKAQ